MYEASRHGVVSGPLEAPPEPRTGAVDRLREEFAQARQDLDEGRLEEAARRFDGIYDEGGWAEAAYNASLAHYGLGRYDLALERSARVAEKRPDDLPGLHLRGVLLHLHGRYGDAEEVSERALAVARASEDRYAEAVGLLNLATSRRFLGRPDAAQESVDGAKALGASLGSREIVGAAWLVDAYLARDRGDAEAAHRAFTAAKAGGASSGGAELDVRLAKAEDGAATGRRAQARKEAERILVDVRAEPSRQLRAVHLLRLAELFMELGDAAQADALLTEADGLFTEGGVDVGRADVLAARARWRFNAGDLAGAEELLLPCIEIREALQVPLALAGSRLILAQVRLEQGRLQEALTLSRAAAERLGAARQQREHRSALLVQSDVLLRAGRLDEALAAAREAAAGTEGDEEQRTGAGLQETIVLARLGRVDEALDRWRATTRPGARISARRVLRGELALAQALELAQRSAEAAARARLALAAYDTAPTGDPVRTPELERAAIEAVVTALLSSGRSGDAADFLASRGLGEGELADAVAAREDHERHDATVALFQGGDLVGAEAAFRALLDDPDLDEGLRGSAARNLTTTVEGIARAALDRGELAAAQTKYAELLRLATDRADSRVAARAGFRLAEIRARVEDPAGAASYAEEAALAAKEADERDLEAALWAMAGDLMFDADPPRARTALQKALVAWGADDRALGKRASVTYNLALLSYQLDDVGEAAVRVQEAKALAGRAGRADLVEMADELAAALKE